MLRWGLMTWIAWALLSGIFAALTAVLAKIGATNVDANLATAVRTSVVIVFKWLLAWLTRQPGALQQFTPKGGCSSHFREPPRGLARGAAG